LGGDSATQYPEKMLVSVLSNFLGPEEIQKHTSFKPGELSLLLQQKEQKLADLRAQEEKELAAGLLWKRLRVGMPLQVDAVFPYILGKNTFEVSYEDLEVDSPYNTYFYKGLPKGPISSPGLQAIVAAIYPIESDYLYYLSKPNKETVFSETLREHNIAKAKYLK